MFSPKVVEFLHYFFLVHVPVTFVQTFEGPDWVIPDVCANVECYRTVVGVFSMYCFVDLSSDDASG